MITVNIKRNDYKVPTEIRQEVVQHVCDAMMDRLMYPFKGPNDWISKYNYCVIEKDGRLGFGPSYGKENVLCKPHGCEIQAAFDAVREAGYFIFTKNLRGVQTYEMSNKPVYGDWYPTTTFNEFID